jgi:hypothetical protein
VPIRSRRAPPIDGRETIILRLEPIESAMDREMSTTYPFPPPQERSVTGSGDPIFPCVSFNLDVPTGAPIYTEGPGEVSAWGSVGRTTCETAPARHRVPAPCWPTSGTAESPYQTM